MDVSQPRSGDVYVEMAFMSSDAMVARVHIVSQPHSCDVWVVGVSQPRSGGVSVEMAFMPSAAVVARVHTTSQPRSDGVWVAPGVSCAVWLRSCRANLADQPTHPCTNS